MITFTWKVKPLEETTRYYQVELEVSQTDPGVTRLPAWLGKLVVTKGEWDLLSHLLTGGSFVAGEAETKIEMESSLKAYLNGKEKE